MIYLVKPNTWFDEDTVAYLVEDYSKNSDGTFSGYGSGLFCGIITVDEDLARIKNKDERLIGKQILDNEICSFEEFDIIEE